ncbi:hypothetical protein F7725_002626 [Dissostichus mawsoni]|uniref:Uncharacterized protein n=1 Tax=Dissostichus mawsoni TaxID=36200 RepID=A0A7J5Y549_DISMA|nr:hypothetical protein F7725_002626 [Dissostichus mawsoni]
MRYTIISVSSVCLQCLFSVSSVSLQCVFSVSSVCLQCLFSVSSVCLQCVFSVSSVLFSVSSVSLSVSSVSLQCVFSVSSVSLQCLFSVSSVSLQCVFSVSSVCLQCLFSVSSVSLQCVFMCLQCLFTVSSVSLQCLRLSVSSVCLQCLFSVFIPGVFVLQRLQRHSASRDAAIYGEEGSDETGGDALLWPAECVEAAGRGRSDLWKINAFPSRSAKKSLCFCLRVSLQDTDAAGKAGYTRCVSRGSTRAPPSHQPSDGGAPQPRAPPALPPRHANHQRDHPLPELHTVPPEPQ